MGSVVAYWHGTLRDEAVRSDLVAYLVELAESSESKLLAEPITRPAFLEALTSERTTNSAPSINVQVFDQLITGRIVIDGELFTYESLPEGLRDTAELLPASSDGKVEPTKTTCVVQTADSKEWYAVPFPAFKLRGIAFRLYDPRGLYPGEDRLSFVFVDCPDVAALDGIIVQVYDHDQCQAFDAEWLREADWVLTRPSIHLRYYLEDWFDLLMTWVKLFFVDDLFYWRYDDMSMFSEIKAAADEIIQARGLDFAKQATFEYLLTRFDEESQKWDGEIEAMAVELGTRSKELSSSEPADAIKSSAPGLPRSSSTERTYAKLFSGDYVRVRKAIDELMELGEEAAPCLVRALHEPLLEHRHGMILEEISEHWFTLESPSLVETLFDFVVGESSNVRYRLAAGRTLAFMGKGVHDQILDRMNSSDDLAWRRIKDSVLNFGDKDDRTALILRGVRHKSGNVKLRACEYIAEKYESLHPYSDPKGPSSLIEALVAQIPMGQEDVRESIIEALLGVGKYAIPALKEMIEARNAEVQSAAITTLGRMAIEPWVDCEPDEIANPEWMQRYAGKLDHPDAAVRSAAAVALHQVAVSITNRQLRKELENAPSTLVVRIAKSHQSMTNQNATSESLRRRLTELMHDSTFNQIPRRRIAAVLLSTQLEFLDTPRKLMWQGLGDLHDPHRKEYLESLLSRHDLKDNPDARILIPRIVGCTGGKPALQVLALRTLAKMKASSDDVVDRVLVCLESKHDEVRMASIETLVALGPCKAEVAYELSRRLLDNDYVLAKAACQALGKQEKNAAVFVQDIVNAADRFELTAVQALATIGTAEARVSVAHVARRTSDEDVIAECNLWLNKWDMTAVGPREDISNEEDREK